MPLMNTYTYVLFSKILSLLHNFIQWNLNSGSGQVQIMLMASWRFAMVRIWQRSQLEIRLNAFCQSTIPQKQFIIIIIPFLMTDKNLKTSLFWVMRKKEAFACTILGKICYVVGTIIRIGKLICLCAILLERHCMSLNDKPAIFQYQTVFTSQNIKQCVCFKPLFKYMMTSSTLLSISFCYEFSNDCQPRKVGKREVQKFEYPREWKEFFVK